MYYFTSEELQQVQSANFDHKTCTSIRRDAANLMCAAGQYLGLPQLTVATGTYYFHKYFASKLFLKDPMERFKMGTACLFLATKVEETPKKLRDVIIWSHTAHLRVKEPKLTPDSPEYEEVKTDVLNFERDLLHAISFHLKVEHPYTPLLKTIKTLSYPLETSRDLAQTAWNIINDSFQTTLCLQFSPALIASAALHIASKFQNISLSAPENNTPEWWTLFGVNFEEMTMISHQLLDIYHVPPPINQNQQIKDKPNEQVIKPRSLSVPLNTGDIPTSPVAKREKIEIKLCEKEDKGATGIVIVGVGGGDTAPRDGGVRERRNGDSHVERLERSESDVGRERRDLERNNSDRRERRDDRRDDRRDERRGDRDRGDRREERRSSRDDSSSKRDSPSRKRSSSSFRGNHDSSSSRRRDSKERDESKSRRDSLRNSDDYKKERERIRDSPSSTSRKRSPPRDHQEPRKKLKDETSSSNHTTHGSSSNKSAERSTDKDSRHIR